MSALRIRKTLVATIAALSLVAAHGASATDYRYLTVTEGKRHETTTALLPGANNGETLLVTVDPETSNEHRITLDGSLAGLKWTITKANGESLEFVRNADIIEITGVSGGSPVLETREIDAAPWFASIPFGLSPFLRSARDEMTFWTINPKNFKPYKMVAERKESREITVRGARIAATRVQVSASGVPAIFFSMDFWLRDSDGVCVRF